MRQEWPGISLTDTETAKRFKDMILDTMDIRKKEKIIRPDMINILMPICEGTLKHQAEGNNKDGFATSEESGCRSTVER